MFDSFEAFIQSLPPLAVLVVIMGVIGLQVLLAVAAAIKRRQFRWEELPKYLESRVLRFGLALGGLAMLMMAAPEQLSPITSSMFYGSALVVLNYLRPKMWNDVLFLMGIPVSVPVPDLPPPPTPPPAPPEGT